jgi:hypothetical protein
MVILQVLVATAGHLKLIANRSVTRAHLSLSRSLTQPAIDNIDNSRCTIGRNRAGGSFRASQGLTFIGLTVLRRAGV